MFRAAAARRSIRAWRTPRPCRSPRDWRDWDLPPGRAGPRSRMKLMPTFVPAPAGKLPPARRKPCHRWKMSGSGLTSCHRGAKHVRSSTSGAVTFRWIFFRARRQAAPLASLLKSGPGSDPGPRPARVPRPAGVKGPISERLTSITSSSSPLTRQLQCQASRANLLGERPVKCVRRNTHCSLTTSRSKAIEQVR